MSKYEWAEVKKLAADFQKAQLTSSLQKLSESNCVEIITKLTQLKLLDVIFTIDGKTYVTPDYLMKEIKDELYVNNGRVSLIDVAKSLNIDVNVIYSLSQNLVKNEAEVQLILGQLINRSYILHITEEINDKLLQHGTINVTELARLFDLPGDFIHSIIRDQNGRLIVNIKQDKQDSLIYYTEVFLQQKRSIIRGAFAAITKPTIVNTIIGQCGINENIFFSLIDNLFDAKQIPGILTERSTSVGTYIPQIHLKIQTAWVTNFFNQNGYLEFDALIRVGINDPKSFISKSLSNNREHLHFFKNSAIGQQLIDQIQTAIEDAMNSNSWINILNLLPTAIDSEDAETILNTCNCKYRHLSQVFSHTYAVSEQFLNSLKNQVCEKIIPVKVKQVVDSGEYEKFLFKTKTSIPFYDNGDKKEISRKEERKKRTNPGKSGGGTQGRETKTKVTKKKYGKAHAAEDSDEDEDKKSVFQNSLQIVLAEDIQPIIESHKTFQDEDFDDSPFVDDLIQYLHPIINKLAIQQAHELHEERILKKNNSKRKMNVELQDSIVVLYHDLKLYQNGIKEYADEDSQQQLNKYLMKTTGTQLVNTCFTFVHDGNEDVTNSAERQKVLHVITNKELREVFSKVNKSVNGGSIEEFCNDVDNVLAGLNILVRKMDKKKEKIFLQNHKQALVDKLKETDAPALILHLTALILFQDVTQNMISTSGRFVPNILNFLQSRMDSNSIQLLNHYHELVIKIFKSTEGDEHRNALDELNLLSPAIKDLVFSITAK